MGFNIGKSLKGTALLGSMDGAYAGFLGGGKKSKKSAILYDILARDAANKGARSTVNSYGNEQLSNDFNNWLSQGNTSYSSKDLVNRFTSKQKQQLQNYIDSNFAGYGGSNSWLNNYWNDNATDELTNNFIDTQYNDALTSLDRALKRGTLSQNGYNNALSNLNTQKSGAYSTIGDIGRGIIDDYKNDLTNKVSGYKTDIDNYNLGNYGTISAEGFKNDFDTLYNNQKNSLENKFNLMTQDQKPFDVSQIIGDARTSQGVNNTQTDQLLGAIEDTETKKDKKVGLGNKGLF